MTTKTEGATCGADGLLQNLPLCWETQNGAPFPKLYCAENLERYTSTRGSRSAIDRKKRGPTVFAVVLLRRGERRRARNVRAFVGMTT